MRVLESIDAAAIRELLARDEFFWLDLRDPSKSDVAELGELFSFHPLALEDAVRGGQRAKLDDYEAHMFLVYYGARWREPWGVDWVEVHAFLSGGYLVTTRKEPSPELDAIRERLSRQEPRSEQFVIYRFLDALTDTFFPVLAGLDERIDQLDTAILARVDEEQLEEIGALRRTLIDMRRVVTPQRDLLARNVDQILELPGLERDSRNYFRDVYDHLIRISDLIDAYRDLLAGSRDAYLSMVSNRLNQITKQLALVATIFLPLAFVTGIFGQNFKWMTDHIQSAAAFFGLGIGIMLVSLVALLAWFRRGGFL